MAEPAFEEFVDECLPTLHRYAYALTGSVHAGEDLVQDTLVKLAVAWRRVRRDGNPPGYARAVMFQTYVSAWRALRRRPVLEGYHTELAADRDQYAEIDARDEVRRALARLPRTQRAVLVLSSMDPIPENQPVDGPTPDLHEPPCGTPRAAGCCAPPTAAPPGPRCTA